MKKIMLITTGGTIACSNTESGLKPGKTGNELLALLPRVPQNISIEITELCNLDSTDVTKEVWLGIAATIQDNYNNFDGFVITHGTDTLSFTAAALSCLIQNSPKPIILTGSQLPMSTENSDAIPNLTNALKCAADNFFHGINVVFGSHIIDGSCAKKIHTTDFNAFVSINKPYVAAINPDGSFTKNTPYIDKSSLNVKFYNRLSDDIGIVTLTPGITIRTVKPVLDIKKCLLLESFGMGGIPCSLYDDLVKLFDSEEYAGKFLIIGTQVLNGGTSTNTYETGKRLQNHIPFIEAGLLTLEMSYTKMMWALAYASDFATIKELFEK